MKRKHCDSEGDTYESIHVAVHEGNMSEVERLVRAKVNINAFDEFGSTSLLYSVDTNRPDMIKFLIQNGANPNLRHRRTNNAPVHSAILYGYLDCLKALVQLGASISVVNNIQQGERPIHTASKLGNVQLVDYLLECGVSPNALSLKERPPLFYCLDHPNVVEVLVTQGADVDYALEYEGFFTPLHLAICNDLGLSVRKLVERGADFDLCCSEYQYTAVHWAAKYNRPHIMETLYFAGADLSAMTPGPEGDQPIHIAANTNVVGMLGYLVSRGVSIETINKYGFAPIHCAAYNSSIDALRYLLQVGASIDRQAHEYKGYTPLHLAATNSEESVVHVVKLLIERGGNWQMEDDGGYTSVHTAVIADNTYFLDEICKHVDLTMLFRGIGRQSLIITAANKNSPKALKWLLDRGICMEQTDNVGLMPIHLACINGFMDIVECLIDNGVDVNVRNNCDETPLHFAVYSKNDALVELLLSKGAYINAVGDFGFRPDHVAAMVGNVKYFQIVEHSIDIAASLAGDEERRLSLHIAAGNGQLEVLRWLLGHGCSVDDRSGIGKTALSVAAEGWYDCVEFLLSKGADVNASYEGEMSMPPLHVAVRGGHREITQLLLDYGAEVDAVGSNGCTPLHLALRNGDPYMIVLLVEYGADYMMVDPSGLSVEGNVDPAGLSVEENLDPEVDENVSFYL